MLPTGRLTGVTQYAMPSYPPCITTEPLGQDPTDRSAWSSSDIFLGGPADFYPKRGPSDVLRRAELLHKPWGYRLDLSRWLL